MFLTDQSSGIDAIHERYERRKSTASPPLLCNSPVPIPTQSEPSTSAPSLTYQLPKFIKPRPARIVDDDAEYLMKKGATGLPLQPLREELLKYYFLYVHPFMPLVDEVDWQRITRKNWDNFDVTREKDDRISLLLYQAVLFAGSAFVPLDLLIANGYSTRKIARKAFFSRTRVILSHRI